VFFPLLFFCFSLYLFFLIIICLYFSVCQCHGCLSVFWYIFLNVFLSLCLCFFVFLLVCLYVSLDTCLPRCLSVIFGELLWTCLPLSWRHVSGCEPNEGGSHGVHWTVRARKIMHKIKMRSKNRHFFALLFLLQLRSLWATSSKWFSGFVKK